MLATILLFIGYAYVCFRLLLNIPLIKNAGLSMMLLAFLFLTKLLGGILYHYINTVRFYGGDSHGLFLESTAYLKLLHTNIDGFWDYWFHAWTRFRLGESFTSVENFKFWSDIGNEVNFRIYTICNAFSFGNEIIPYIFYNCIFFIGLIALYRFFKYHFPERKIIILCFLFFVPSIWFWCSGVHKDGLVLSFLSLFLYYYNKYLISKQKRYIFFSLLFFLLTISVRYYISIILLPLTIMLLIANRWSFKAKYVFSIGLILFFVIFFNVSKFNSKINPPQAICDKQAKFMVYKATSMIPTKKLEPSATSFAKNLPNALNNCLMRPYIFEAKDKMYVLCALETTLLFLLLLLLIFTTPFNKYQNPIFVYGVLLSLLMFIIIGYIVPFCGAFIRYRSEYFPFIFGVLLGLSNWKILDRIEGALKKLIR